MLLRGGAQTLDSNQYIFYSKIVPLSLNTYMFTRFGAPWSIITDQGREFINSVCKRLFDLNGTHYKAASTYHSQCNGLVEWYNRPFSDLCWSLSVRSKIIEKWLGHVSGWYVRKAVPPIQNSSNSDKEVEGKMIETAEEIVAWMKSMKKDLFQSAKDKIVKDIQVTIFHPARWSNFMLISLHLA